MSGPRAATLAMAATLLVTHVAAQPDAEISRPYRLSPHVAPGQAFMGIRLLGTRVLDPVERDGMTL
ncbi:MAG: hypothetical protein GWM90_04620, partial [Gemmatimonadetes bacterium]|nr:hypothetical protein [Gemmatimonadota bacterium]NIQ52976.1 hypothetical protein [Gemmatimonadota bacterium]NIU73111.1 hypothetical protein [Gammaproteobacteria bacterium]NIX19286.1 hypothetical protein [Actinomycetota bacterium]NIX43425.1 hypothetical protein [Gemmatimonadota bacterium]